MLCPFCRHPGTQVLDSRACDEGAGIRRRRRCPKCGRRFTTYERPELAMPSVRKRDGDRRDFDRGKLRASMALALRKRPVGREALDAAVDRIEERVRQIADKEISSRRIGELVMDELRALDNVAYVRFASVYWNFPDLGAFDRLIQELKNKDKNKDKDKEGGSPKERE